MLYRISLFMETSLLITLKCMNIIFVATFEHLLSRTSLHVNIKMCPYAFVLKLIQASEA